MKGILCNDHTNSIYPAADPEYFDRGGTIIILVKFTQKYNKIK